MGSYYIPSLQDDQQPCWCFVNVLNCVAAIYKDQVKVIQLNALISFFKPRTWYPISFLLVLFSHFPHIFWVQGFFLCVFFTAFQATHRAHQLEWHQPFYSMIVVLIGISQRHTVIISSAIGFWTDTHFDFPLRYDKCSPHCFRSCAIHHVSTTTGWCFYTSAVVKPMYSYFSNSHIIPSRALLLVYDDSSMKVLVVYSFWVILHSIALNKLSINNRLLPQCSVLHS